MVINVYVEDQDFNTVKMFKEEDGYEVVTDLDKADIICLVGGADVSPILYREGNTQSHCDMGQDLKTISLALYAQRCNIPLVGICRGGQFINVWNGGRMIQHREGHTIPHNVHIYGHSYKVTSGHHQEMIPPVEDAMVLGVAEQDGCVEIIAYDVGDLAFQPHPEWVDHDHDCRRLFFKLIKEYVVDV